MEPPSVFEHGTLGFKFQVVVAPVNHPFYATGIRGLLMFSRVYKENRITVESNTMGTKKMKQKIQDLNHN